MKKTNQALDKLKEERIKYSQASWKYEFLSLKIIEKK